MNEPERHPEKPISLRVCPVCRKDMRQILRGYQCIECYYLYEYEKDDWRYEGSIMNEINIIRSGTTKIPENFRKCPECCSTDIRYETLPTFGTEGWMMECLDCKCEWTWEKPNETTK